MSAVPFFPPATFMNGHPRWLAKGGDAAAGLSATVLILTWLDVLNPHAPKAWTTLPWQLWTATFPAALMLWPRAQNLQWPQAGLRRGLGLLDGLMQTTLVTVVLGWLLHERSMEGPSVGAMLPIAGIQLVLGQAWQEVLHRRQARHTQGRPDDAAVQPLPMEARLAKRVFDLVVASVALLLFLPWGLLIAALIRLESAGPVIFRQRRHGRHDRLFQVYKFRSMRFDPVAQRGGIVLTERGDARVTRTGDFLRRTSLDEFPQFFNVIKGDMSVVGPRPHPPGVKAGNRLYEEVVQGFSERYKVRPGITGWAQVTGWRGNTFTENDLTQRYARDIAYIRHWSLALDVWIVAKTLVGGFGGHNAF